MDGNWIRVEDELPNQGESVICYGDRMGYNIGWLNECGHFEADNRFLEDTTHWQPLPAPPKN